MKIYAVAGYAQRNDTDANVTTVNTFPFAIKANNPIQAEAEGMTHLLEFCPRIDGWNSHDCRAIQVPDEWMSDRPA